MSRLFQRLFLFMLPLLLGACTGVPKGLSPVSGFEEERYLGRWYEIARLDHSFERGLSHVTADYALNKNGTLSVVNRGWNAEKGEWKEARGVARFRGDRTVGSLKVSFFRPFYGGYHVIALDQEEYQWAMVSGPNRSYLWILARTPELEESVYEALVEQARTAGFATDELIRVEQLPPITD